MSARDLVAEGWDLAYEEHDELVKLGPARLRARARQVEAQMAGIEVVHGYAEAMRAIAREAEESA